MEDKDYRKILTDHDMKFTQPGVHTSNELRPPDSTGNGTDGWRITSSYNFSHWIYLDPNGRYYEFKWDMTSETMGSSEWISNEYAEKLIRESKPVQWGK